MVFCIPRFNKIFRFEKSSFIQSFWKRQRLKNTAYSRETSFLGVKRSLQQQHCFFKFKSNDQRSFHSNNWKAFIFLTPWTIHCQAQTDRDDILYNDDTLQKGSPHIPSMQSSMAREYFGLAIVEKGFKKVWFILLASMQVVSGIWRTVQLFFIFLPNLSTLPVQYLLATRYKTSNILDEQKNTFREDSEKNILNRLTRFERWWYQTLLKAIELAGPTFIKLGQWASTRPDVFSKGLAIILSKLHDRVSHHSFQVTKRTIEDAFGRPLDSVFETFEKEAAGSGCIAQVHQAQIKVNKTHATLTPGEDHRHLVQQVAVKVRHPDIPWIVARDLSIMRFFARCINVIPNMEWLSLPEEVEQFAQCMSAQLDFRLEANNFDRFNENFQNNSHVHFPKAIRPWITEDVLVESFEEGIPIRRFLNLNKASLFNVDIAHHGLYAFLKMVLSDNFVHSDLHPGNLFVQFRKNQSQISSFEEICRTNQDEIDTDKLNSLARAGYQPHLIFLDVGLVTELTNENRKNFLDLFKAVAEGDGDLAATLMVERSRTKSCLNLDRFRDEMGTLVTQIQKKTFQLSSFCISDVLSKVLSMVQRYHVKIESDFTNLVVSIMVLEGLGRQLNPTLDLFAAALPILRTAQIQQFQGGQRPSSAEDVLYLKIWAWFETRNWLVTKLSLKYEDQLGWMLFS